MAKINPRLFSRLQKKLVLKPRRLYQLIDEKVRETHLPRNLAAIVVASEHGINISPFATEEDLASIRQGARSSIPPSVVVPGEFDKHKERGHKTKAQSRSFKEIRRRGNTVFVVHGRNERARRALFEFLRALSLKPIEWTQAIKKTGQGSPYVGDILEMAFREAAAVVVLLTPDDEARLKSNYRGPRDPSYESRLKGQPRPNVLFEAGMSFGRNPNSTVLVEIGDIRSFSDISGRHTVRMSNDPIKRQELATKLANAGCNVDTSGTDWLSAGDFNL